VHPNAAAMFTISLVTSVGNGESTHFWTDKCLHGGSVDQLAPDLSLLIPKRVFKERTVKDALLNRQWIKDIRGGLHVQALIEFLWLWDVLLGIQLMPGVPDHHL
jgi:hypothetical protein